MNTQIRKNQIRYYNTISLNEDNLIINPSSNCHLININNALNHTIQFSQINDPFILNKSNLFIEQFLILQNNTDTNFDVNFNSNIINLNNINLTIPSNHFSSYHLFSIDHGNHWFNNNVGTHSINTSLNDISETSNVSTAPIKHQFPFYEKFYNLYSSAGRLYLPIDRYNIIVIRPKGDIELYFSSFDFILSKFILYLALLRIIVIIDTSLLFINKSLSFDPLFKWSTPSVINPVILIPNRIYTFHFFTCDLGKHWKAIPGPIFKHYKA